MKVGNEKLDQVLEGGPASGLAFYRCLARMIVPAAGGQLHCDALNALLRRYPLVWLAYLVDQWRGHATGWKRLGTIVRNAAGEYERLRVN
jgi:hypothetical protein